MWQFLIAFGLIALIYWIFSKPKNFPPGPPRLPLIGSLPFVDTKKQPLLYLAFEETGEKWGCNDGIMGLYVGNKPTVAIWDPKLVREVLQRDEFQGRPDAFLFRMRSFGKRRGIFFGDGSIWAEQRRFTLRHLRDLGVLGPHKIQHRMQNEITVLTERIMNHPEGPLQGSRLVPVNDLFAFHIVNVLWALLSGKQYSYDDAELQKLFDMLTRMIHVGQESVGLLNSAPWIRFILPNISQYNEVMETFASLQKFIKDTIDEHKADFDKHKIDNFIDVYLLEMELHVSEESSFNEEELITICMDLLGAASETVANTLSFAILYLGHYPRVQAHLWEEINKELGIGCCPCLEDRNRLPYLEAVIQEIMRINPVAPFTVPHRATEDTNLAGYTIPKDTELTLSLWAVSHDASKWKDPHEFQPERFMDENGLLIRDAVSLNFGYGKRQCLGMPFARGCLFLFIGALVANFEFQFVPDDPLPSTVPLPGFSTCPKPFNILAINRKQAN